MLQSPTNSAPHWSATTDNIVASRDGDSTAVWTRAVDDSQAAASQAKEQMSGSDLPPTQPPHSTTAAARSPPRQTALGTSNPKEGGKPMRRPSLIPPNLLPSLPTFDMPALEGFLARFGPHGGDDNEEAAVACPPIEAEGYKPKGVFKELFGYQCYVVGPDPSLDCVVCAYDIFGFSLQVIQGADILHTLTDSTIYIPDFFHGQPFPTEAYPPTTPEQVADLQTFFSTKGNLDDRRDNLIGFGYNLRDRFKGQTWAEEVRIAAYGISWGAKIAFLAGSSAKPFHAVAVVSPAFLTLPDAEALKVPVAVLCSKDEPADVTRAIVEAFRRKTFSSRCIVHTWGDMLHGFPGARGNLRDRAVALAFEECYLAVGSFLRNAKRMEAPAGGGSGRPGGSSPKGKLPPASKERGNKKKKGGWFMFRKKSV